MEGSGDILGLSETNLFLFYIVVFDHVVEIFDFSPEFKDHDLQSALSKFQ